MINRRKILSAIGTACFIPKICFAQKTLLPETQKIIDIVNTWNLKDSKISFFIDDYLHKQKLFGIYFWVFNADLKRASIVTWPMAVDTTDPMLVIKELRDYFGGEFICDKNVRPYGLVVNYLQKQLKIFV